MKVQLLDERNKVVAEKDVRSDEIAGVSVLVHEGVNYSFSRLSGPGYQTIEFHKCGRVEDF